MVSGLFFELPKVIVLRVSGINDGSSFLLVSLFLCLYCRLYCHERCPFLGSLLKKTCYYCVGSLKRISGFSTKMQQAKTTTTHPFLCSFAAPSASFSLQFPGEAHKALSDSGVSTCTWDELLVFQIGSSFLFTVKHHPFDNASSVTLLLAYI